MGIVSPDGFELQTAKGPKIDTIKLSYGDVRSVTEKRSGARTALWILAGVGIGIAVVIAALAIAYYHS